MDHVIDNAKGKHKRGPPSLMSMSYPKGLPGLRGVNRTRVRQANKLSEFRRQVMDLRDLFGAKPAPAVRRSHQHLP